MLEEDAYRISWKIVEFKIIFLEMSNLISNETFQSLKIPIFQYQQFQSNSHLTCSTKIPICSPKKILYLFKVSSDYISNLNTFPSTPKKYFVCMKSSTQALYESDLTMRKISL